MLARFGLGCGLHRFELTRLDLVGLGQHDPVADRRGVEHFEHVAVDLLDPVAAVDQHERAFQHRAAAEVIVDQEAPFLDDILGRLGKAIAGHVDEPEDQRILADVEIVELLRPSRRHRSARKAVAVRQRVEQRRLADVRAPRERDFGHARRGQMLERGRRFQERDGSRKQLARALRPFGVGPGFKFDFAHVVGAAFSCGNLRYIHCCCAIDRILLVIQ